MRTSELSGKALEAWIAKALSEPAGTEYLARWPGIDLVMERFGIQATPMPGKGWIWCAVVVGRPGGGVQGGPWLEGQSIRIAVGRAIVAARFGTDLPET